MNEKQITDMKNLVNLANQIGDYKEQCKRTHYFYSMIVSSKNSNESQPSKNNIQTEWMYQSFRTFNMAERLLQDCQRIIIHLSKSVNKDVVNIDILEVQNEIVQCLRNFQQQQKDQMYRNHNENLEALMQKFLLPEALFDKYFDCVITLAHDLNNS